MNYPVIVEERDSERDLTCKRSNLLADYVRVFIVHLLKVRPEYLQHQHVMFSVWALYLKMVQGCEDAVESRMCP